MERFSFKDENDKHVVATAIEGNAEYIFTFNLKDFPNDVLGKFGVRALSPDSFFSELIPEDERKMVKATQKLLSRYRHPPLEQNKYFEILDRSQMRRTSDRLRNLLH